MGGGATLRRRVQAILINDKFASWNIRGLNAPHKYKEINETIVDYKLSLLCLVDNKVNYKNIDKIKRKCIPHWS